MCPRDRLSQRFALCDALECPLSHDVPFVG